MSIRGCNTSIIQQYSQTNKEARLRKLLAKADTHTLKRFRWDDEALWSLTNFQIGSDICVYLLHLKGITRKSIITDAFAGVGGNTIQFGRYFERVRAVELNPLRKEMLDSNLKLYSLKNVDTYTNYFQNMSNLTQDVVFFDPPWGADYRKHPVGTMRITVSGPCECDISLEELIAQDRVSKYCVVKLPFNYDLKYFEHELAKNGVGKIIHVKNYPRPNTMMIVYIQYVIVL